MTDTTIEDNNYWSEVITPKNKLFDLRLRDIWRYRDLLVLFVKRDFAAQYKQTILGPLWHIIQPVLTTFLSIVLFVSIAKIELGAIPPTLFYLSSYAMWNYFSACLTGTSNTFVSNAGIFGKVYFPRLILPLSVVVSNIAKFGIQLSLLAVFMIIWVLLGKYSFNIGWHTLLIPVLLVLMAGMGLGLGIIISSFTTKYRDFTVLAAFGAQLLMYITPVVYPMAYLAIRRPKLSSLLEWNPLTPLLEGLRYAVFGIGTFNVGMLLYSFVVSTIVLITGIVIFNRVERSFMDTV